MSDPLEPRTLCACGYAFEIGEQPDDIVVVTMHPTPIARPLCSDAAERVWWLPADDDAAISNAKDLGFVLKT